MFLTSEQATAPDRCIQCLESQGWLSRSVCQVRHDQNVTWLAFWKDSISDKDYKYVWLGADSAFKSTSDLAKYEKARKLKVPFPHQHSSNPITS